MASAVVAIPEHSYTRFGRNTPRLKARLQPITYIRSNGDQVRISEMHDFHLVNAIAKIRRDRVFGCRSFRHSALPDLQIEARKRGFVVE